MEIDFTPDPSLYPFESRWFDLPTGGRMHYIDEGSGETIVFFHGNPTWSFLYRKIVVALRDRFRCIAMDYPGFGLSDRPPGYGYTIEEHARSAGALVDHLGLERFITMGQDWGGPVGMAVATERAGRVDGVILGNTWFWPATTKFKVFSKIMSSGPIQRRILQKNFFVEKVMPVSMTAKLTRAEMDHYRRAQPEPSARRGVAEMPKQIVGATPLLRRLAEDVPRKLGDKRALVVWGMKDPGFDRKVLPRVRGAFSDVEVRTLPDAKHFIQEDAPDEIADAIIKRFG